MFLKKVNGVTKLRCNKSVELNKWNVDPELIRTFLLTFNSANFSACSEWMYRLHMDKAVQNADIHQGHYLLFITKYAIHTWVDNWQIQIVCGANELDYTLTSHNKQSGCRVLDIRSPDSQRTEYNAQLGCQAISWLPEAVQGSHHATAYLWRPTRRKLLLFIAGVGRDMECRIEN